MLHIYVCVTFYCRLFVDSFSILKSTNVICFLACGRDITVTTNAQIITNSYSYFNSNNRRCNWDLTASSGYKINVKFTRFQISNGYVQVGKCYLSILFYGTCFNFTRATFDYHGQVVKVFPRIWSYLQLQSCDVSQTVSGFELLKC